MLRHRLPQLWYGRCKGGAAILSIGALLLPLSVLFVALSRLRRALYHFGLLRQQRLPCPVIIIGNVTAGGSGKTPLVQALARSLSQAGWRVGILARGYGAKTLAAREVQGRDDVAQSGDEPLLHKLHLAADSVPVFIGRARAAAGRALLARYPQTNLLLCDDGLQHYALARDIEILAIGAAGFGNGLPLPAGPLRECPQRPADFTLYAQGRQSSARAGFVAQRSLGRIAALAHWRTGNAEAQSGEVFTPQSFAARIGGQSLLAAAGIAQPEEFFALLQTNGLTPTRTLALSDHYAFDPLRPLPWHEARESIILMTEKDAVKCAQHPAAQNDARLFVVSLALHLPPDFVGALLGRLRSLTAREPI